MAKGSGSRSRRGFLRILPTSRGFLEIVGSSNPISTDK